MIGVDIFHVLMCQVCFCVDQDCICVCNDVSVSVIERSIELIASERGDHDRASYSGVNLNKTKMSVTNPNQYRTNLIVKDVIGKKNGSFFVQAHRLCQYIWYGEKG